MHFATGCTQPTTGGFLAADPVTLLRCYARLSRLHSSAPAEPAPFPQLQSMELQDEPNLGVHPAKKIKAAFYAELIPLLDQVSEQSQHMLHKGSFPWHKKENKHSVGESDRSNICWWQWLLTVLKCSWTSLCPKKTQKTNSKQKVHLSRNKIQNVFAKQIPK